MEVINSQVQAVQSTQELQAQKVWAKPVVEVLDVGVTMTGGVNNNDGVITLAS